MEGTTLIMGYKPRQEKPKTTTTKNNPLVMKDNPLAMKDNPLVIKDNPLVMKNNPLTPYEKEQHSEIITNETIEKELTDTVSYKKPEQQKQGNQKFFDDINDYVDGEISIYKNKLLDLEKKYTEKKWKIDKSKGNFKTYQDRIDVLKGIKEDFKEMKNIAAKSFGNNLLTLANVVHNEAAQSNNESKKAVAYAYLNRIEYIKGSVIREPKDAEISHYLKLLNRWISLDSDSAKLTFLKNFRASFNAAQARLINTNPIKNDPTKGATHWISPMASLFDKKSGGNTNQRTINGKTRYVPEWARSNDDPKLESLMKGANAILNSDFKEIQLNSDFFFYKGVKYKK